MLEGKMKESIAFMILLLSFLLIIKTKKEI